MTSLYRLLVCIKRWVGIGKSNMQSQLFSAEIQKQRRQSRPTPNFNPSLPVTALRNEIEQIIQAHPVIILAGETGSGKTTQLPQICLNLNRGISGYIGHTQPRRIAARNVAHRLAEELKVTLGQQVGYKIRFQDQVTPESIIKVMTDGILLAEIQRDRYLKQYDTLIIDEAHERSLNIDFLLGYLKKILPQRPDLKLIITSATLDHQRFSDFFNQAPIVEVPGKTYPIEVLYRPRERFISQENHTTEKIATEIPHAVLAAVQEIIQIDRRNTQLRPRDILIFFSGENEIRETSQCLRRATLAEIIDILPLYARLPPKEQQRVFQTSAHRRIILTTNVAETSLTVPNIGYVIDTGYARISQYSVQSKIQRLPIVSISKASANQRMGRCGRIAPGLCIRLYSENDFNSRSDYTPPELLRSNLAAVILRMATLSLGDIEKFPFVDPPNQRLINDGYRLLQDLGAMDKNRRLTHVGQQMTAFPVDPRLSRLLVAAHQQHCLQEMLIIVSALSIQNTLLHGNNAEKNPMKSLSIAPYPTSQFMDFIFLWQAVEIQHQALTRKQFSQWCEKYHLPERILKEWRELHCQLTQICETLSWRINQQTADQATLHKALLTGLLDHIAQRKENREYHLARQRTLLLPRNTPWQKNLPSWIVAAELIEVQGLIASHIAEIQPEWIESVAAHRLKKTHQDIHWEMQRGQVMAYEQASLYGLIIYTKRKIHYGPIDPIMSREIFIRSALSERKLKTKATFYLHNQNLIAQVEQLEDKIRRQDLLISEQTLFEFYDGKIPNHIYSQALLEQWLSEKHQIEKLLYLSESDLLQRSTDHIHEQDFPNIWPFSAETLSLSYHFEPNHPADGVTLVIPLAYLETIEQSALDWLVPGLLAHKCEALLRGLPKSKRRAIVPIPDYVKAFLQAQKFGEGLLFEKLAHHIYRMTGIKIQMEDWSLQNLDSCYQMNLQILEDKKILAEGRSLLELKKQLQTHSQAMIQQSTGAHIYPKKITHWNFGDLPESQTLITHHQSITVYPTLAEVGNQVEIILCPQPEQAQEIMQPGQRRLYWHALEKTRRYLFKSCKIQLERFILYFPFWSNAEILFEEISLAVIQWEILEDRPLVRKQALFEQNLSQGTPKIIQQLNQVILILEESQKLFANLRQIFKQYHSPGLHTTLADIQKQMDQLIYSGFILNTPKKFFARFPIYLTAIETRLKRISGNVSRDQKSTLIWQSLALQVEQKKSQLQSAKPTSKLTDIRWMLEEYRLILFAQPQKTLIPISEQRILKLLSEVKS